MPKIIGWDIGIKNLSYCIFDTENPENKYKEYFEIEDRCYYLVDWQVLNLIPTIKHGDNEILLSSINKNHICEYEIKTNKNEIKSCKTKAKFVIWPNSDIKAVKYYCAKHRKLLDNVENIEDINLKGVNCFFEDECNTNAVYVSKNNCYYGYCKKHYNQAIKKNIIKEDDVFKIIKEKKADKNNLTLLAEALYTELNKYPQILDTNCVLFENQPVLKNPTMKSMQIFLYGYYMMNGYMSNNSSVEEIHCYNANKKIEMQYFVAEEDLKCINEDIGKLKSKYSQTKKKGIALVEYFFANNYVDLNDGDNTECLISIFNDKKKRDDLADSFLMTLHYLEKKRVLQLKKFAL